MLFNLELTGITFSGQLPSYPTLIDPQAAQDLLGLQLEPAIKGPIGGKPSGPFEVVFGLDPQGDVEFLMLPNQTVSLSRINGSNIGQEEGWFAAYDTMDPHTCRLQWTREEPPETQVVRIDCVRGNESLYLFFSWVLPFPLVNRVTYEPRPTEGSSIPSLHLVEDSNELVFTAFRSSARSQLAQGYQFEPTLRVFPNQEVQFQVVLDPAINRVFEIGTLGNDEVPVSYYVGEVNGSALRPTLRSPDSQTCVVTWWTSELHPAPASGFVTFNLEMKPASPTSLGRRVDPTIIEDPHVIPAVEPESA